MSEIIKKTIDNLHGLNIMLSQLQLQHLAAFIESNYIPKEEHKKVYMGRELAEERLHECRNDLMNKTLESAKLKGEYIGTLKAILLWDIPEELKDKLKVKLKELEEENNQI